MGVEGMWGDWKHVRTKKEAGKNARVTETCVSFF